MKYTLLAQKTLTELVRETEEYIRGGWKLVGSGIQVLEVKIPSPHGSYPETYFCREMVFGEDDDD